MKTSDFKITGDFEVSFDESNEHRIVLIRKKLVFAEKLEDIERPWFINSWGGVGYCEDVTVNHFKTEERAKQVLALIQLLAFRDDIWEKEGRRDKNKCSYNIRCYDGTLSINTTWSSDYLFNFKSKETAEYFLEKHKDLLNEWGGGI